MYIYGRAEARVFSIDDALTAQLTLPAATLSREATPSPAVGGTGGGGGAGGSSTASPTAAPTNTDGTRGFLEGDNNGDGIVDSMDDINGAFVELFVG